jgi:hypothetical protein
MESEDIVFDVKKALNNECEDMGIFTINKIIGNLQLSYLKKDSDDINAFENVINEYYKDPNRDKIELVYINKKADYWTFIENDDDEL